MQVENATHQRLQSAEEELGNLKKFILSSASLRIASSDSQAQYVPAGKKKTSRRATCDSGAFSADLFRNNLSLIAPSLASTHGFDSGYRRGSALDMARSLFVEAVAEEAEDTAVSSSFDAASAASISTVRLNSLVPDQLSKDKQSMPNSNSAAPSSSDAMLLDLQLENRELKAKLAQQSAAPRDVAAEMELQKRLSMLEHESLLKEAALAQLHTALQQCRSLETCLADAKSDHEKSEAAWKQESSSTVLPPDCVFQIFFPFY